MVRKISGKFKPPNYTHLNIDDEEKASTTKDIADTLGSTFMRNSSSRNYSNKFQTIKKEQKKRKLNFKSPNNANYNNPLISLNSLKPSKSLMIPLQVQMIFIIRC